ncbi:hypothetical protein ACP3V3_22175, partial [Vibrio sp. PNB22_3_1]
AKAPHTLLPSTATQGWDVEEIVADQYGVQFTADNAIDANSVTLGQYTNGEWHAIAPENCVVDMAWNEDFANGTTPEREAGCEAYP